MPLSVLEAMAAGLPVVATDVGDVRGMLADANAALVCPAEDGAFAAALRTLLIDPALRLAVGQANRAKAASDYDQEAMFLRYDALWRGIYGG
jgi:glycosyltransferase involved in cell wall biosynthesis